MKKLIFSLGFMTTIGMANAQVLNPVLWTFTAKKIAPKTYELHFTAIIQNTWHLYSQTQPSDAIVNPTTILFNGNPLVILDGKPKEIGKMEVYSDKKLGISANQYSNKLELVQKIKLKTDVKTNISGSVEYQTCDDKKCLPLKKLPFNLALK